MVQGRDTFDDLVPPWMFRVRGPLGRLAVAAVVTGLLLLPLLLLESPDDLRLAPMLTLGLVLVAAVAGWWPTALAGVVLVTGYWWSGVPPAESFELPTERAWVGLGSMVVLTIGLVALCYRVERAVDDVRLLDEQRRHDHDRVERDASDVRAALELSSILARASTMAEAARLVLDGIRLPIEPTSGSIAIVNDGHLRVLAARGADEEFIAGLERVDIRDSQWLVDVMHGDPAFVDDREAFAARHPTARVLLLYPSGSWIVVPFRSESTVGLLSLHYATPQRVSDHRLHFTLVAEILASALERTNAEERRLAHLEELQQSFAERDRIARTLSTTLLPPSLPALDGCTAAGWIIPASNDEVAGDFYDIFPVVGGGWVAVLGDVCGKGAEAAAVASLSRYAARVTALVDPDPRRIAEVANAALRSDQSDLFCTMVIVQYLPAEQAIDVTLAGHHQARVVSAGAVHRVGQYSAPLGLAERPHGVERHPFGPGDSLILFSDGLIERHPDFGEDDIDRGLKSIHGPADEAVEKLRSMVLSIEAERHDDLAALVVSRS
jgi:sigma-B regulation protein RsbU (phosphoserine phosphatase)